MIRKKATKTAKKDKRNGVARESYNVPDQVDLDNLQAEYEKFACKLVDNKSKPITEAQVLGLIRSVVREKWMYYDVKLAFIHSKAVPDYDPLTRRRFKYQCACCNQWFTKSEVDVDHIKQVMQLKLTSVFEYAQSVLDVGFDDLQLLCHECHDIKTYSERLGCSYDQARIKKQALSIQHENDLEWLMKHNIVPGKNKKIRLQQIEDALKVDNT